MLFRTEFPPGTSLARRFWYPPLRCAFFFVFSKLTYWRIRRVNKPDLKGSYIWSSSHSNFLGDVVVAGYETPVLVRFLAKASLFVFPIKGFFEFCGALPLVRPGDQEKGESRQVQNRKSFSAAIDALKAGWPIAIYPEGSSVVGAGLFLPLKPGIAKLAFSAEEASNFSLGIKVIPVGLEYGSRAKIGSGLTIRYGAPIVVAKYREQYLENEAAAVKSLMEEITSQMISVFPHFLSDEQLNQGKKLFTSGLVDSKHEAAQLFLAQEKNENFWTEFKSELLQFEEASKDASIPLTAWGQVKRWNERSTWRRFARGFYLVMGIPLAVVEFFNDALAEKVVSTFVNYLAVDETEVMSFRFLGGPFFVIPVYLFQFWLGKKYLFAEALHRSDIGIFFIYALSSMMLWYAMVHWRRLLASWASLWFFWRADEDSKAQAKRAYDQMKKRIVNLR